MECLFFSSFIFLKPDLELNRKAKARHKMITLKRNDKSLSTPYIYETGFTVIEIIIVLVIIGILGLFSVQSYEKYMDEARISEAKADIFSLEVKINYFQVTRLSYPNTIDDIAGVPLDPWGNPYQYLNIQTVKNKGKGKLRKDHNLVPINSDYDLYSMGKDGRSVSPLTAKHSRDDIIRANNGEYVGLAEDY